MSIAEVVWTARAIAGDTLCRSESERAELLDALLVFGIHAHYRSWSP